MKIYQKYYLFFILILILMMFFSSCRENETDIYEQANTDVEIESETQKEGLSDTDAFDENESEINTETDTDTDTIIHFHIEEIIPLVLPTCTQEGFTEGKKCSVCDEIIKNPEKINSLGHTSVILPQETPTCTSLGKTQGLQCSTCNEILCSQEEIPMLEHSYKAHNSKTSTCVERGWESYITCLTCDYTTIKFIPALGHDFQRESTVAATCIAGGYDVFKCSRCDATENRNETSISTKPEAHNFEEIRIEPTCTTRGSSETKCTLCGANQSDKQTLQALKHTYERTYADGEVDNTVVNVVKPTCTTNGSITYSCPDCNASTITRTYEELSAETATDADKALAETIKALGHDFSVVKEDKPAECLTAGYKIMSCKNGCGETENAATYEPLGHSYEREGAEIVYGKVTVQPTCVEKGLQWAVCADCSYSADQDEIPTEIYSQQIPATGVHDFAAFVRNTTPTCTTQGYDTYRCANCQETTQTNYVDPQPHTWVLDEDMLIDGNPYCLTNGNYPYYCSAMWGKNNNVPCAEFAKDGDKREYNVNGEEAGAIKHAYVSGEWTIAPTCITPATYTCTQCTVNFVAYEEDTAAQATGVHNYSIANVVNATCTDYGYTKYYCSDDENCTAFENREFTVRKSHKFTDNTEKCDICEESFVNIKEEVSSLCTDPFCGGCEYDEIFSIVTIGELSTDLYENITFEEHLTREKVALIELIGELDTVYEVELFDYEGNQIESFTINFDGTDVELDINFETTVKANGKKYIDITEVENIVSTIVITASTEAKVNFYCRSSNIDSLI